MSERPAELGGVSEAANASPLQVAEVAPVRTSVLLRLTLVAVVLLGALKAVTGRSSPLRPLFASWALEACIFLAIYLLADALGRLGRARRLHLPGLFFAVLFGVHSLTAFFYAFFFTEAVARRPSMLDVDLDAVSFFFREIVPLHGYLVMGGAAGLLAILTLLAGRLRFAPSRRALACCSLLAGVLGLGLGRPLAELPTPLVDLTRDLAEIRSHAPLTVEPGVTPAAALEDWDRPPAAGTVLTSPYRKILIFVMEQITLQTLLRDSAVLPASSFFHRTAGQTHAYLEFFSSDQDSRTGMLAELSGRFVPFEAYNAPDLDRYRKMERLPTLLDLAAAGGYTTAFAASETEHEEVVWDLPWTERYALSEQEVAEAKGMLCFNPYEFEHSCEDRILLPRLFNFFDHHERVFLFDEFIYGHSSDYQEATHKTPVQYYDEYLSAWYDHLQQTHQLDDTLIVVTSDHGIRDWGYEQQLSSYNIPLLFVHPSFQRQEDRSLHAQFDFPAILLAEATGAGGSLPRRDFVPFVGSTTKSIVGAVTSQHDLLLIKNRPHFRYVLFQANQAAADGATAPPRALPAPGRLLRMFEDYRSFFLSDRLR